MTRWVAIVTLTIACGPAILLAEATNPDAAAATVEPSVAEITRPQDVLRLFDIDDSVLRFFSDRQPLTADELEPVYRLMYLLPRLDAVQRYQWHIIPTEWASLVADPPAHRANMYQLTGHVTSVTQHTLPAEAARRFDYDHFEVLEIASTLDERTLVVCTPQVPAKWPRDVVGQPVSCDAVFLKVGQGAPGHEALVFATDRIAWHPNAVATGNNVSAGAALLGSFGMDVSQFERVAQQHPLGAHDRDCFYQLLWSVRRMDAAAVTKAVSDTSLPVVRVLQHPEDEAGKVYRLRGTARRALRIRVDEADIHERFGIDHYYEIEFFTPLDQPLQLVDPSDGETRGYQNYPVTVCVAELPAGMPQGDEIRQDIIVEGFFMKLWSYRSRFAAGPESSPQAASRRQVSPLLIARSVRLFEAQLPANPWPAWWMAGMVAGGIALSLWIRWWFARGDRPLEQWRSAHASNFQLPTIQPPDHDPDR